MHATVWVEADRERPSGRTLYVDGFASSYVDLDDPTHLRYGYMRHLAALIDVSRQRLRDRTQTGRLRRRRTARPRPGARSA